ncbi:TetR family transcriptional regulator C-terminal domain-containing protein [Priestia flexa]|uniref:TetR/AcrR family transcriptional regulator n=1 Tax=Priestia flexa TaxID=86664 RepID=UPI000C24AE38|nr:TetR family transcriptional regulator C-terminal domain-containing protein [Priestia flexa]MEC0665067.1 TetR family transcriptional regulator C-terminal domain-containing protein [Priestia flexa]
MPKLVDHQKRKEQIARATWRVILKQGMEGTTVRNIAKEANLSLGSLRHYFSSQDDLLAYAMELVKEQAERRIVSIASQDLPPQEKVLKMLLEIVPTNDEKMAEMEVWLIFTAHHKHKNQGPIDDGIFSGMKKIMLYLENENVLKEKINTDLESEKLYALIDGLALHAMFDRDRVTSDRVEAVIRDYLQSICSGQERGCLISPSK